MITINTPGAAYEYEYKGLSTDEKPTDCAANSLFLELDTGKFYYFDGEAWNELGTGGGGGGGDVLFDGDVTFEYRGDDPEPYSTNITDISFTRMPENGEDVYCYMDDDPPITGTWELDDGDYIASLLYAGDPIARIFYNSAMDRATINFPDNEIEGEKHIEIRKTAKPID